MKIQDATVLITGANRGIGKSFAEEALARGARKVYAAARDPRTVTTPGVEPVRLDITDPAAIAELAERLTDVDILVNNAGVALSTSIIDDDLETIRREMEVNYYGPLQVSRAFAPTLTAREGHLLIVNSALSWAVIPGTAPYAATKAASWMLANALRLELAPKVGVTSLHVGYVDTDMAAGVTGEKVPPAEVAREAFDGIEKGAMEVLVDGTSRQVKAALSLDPSALYGS
ncbi:SDR family NAD(P)-dependent oxidoreductase [Herbidospora galbida]|uniref:SDR family NAD(P)-dependent oxidoreductase n=1 Tax=Herbidospora galbida TaxID=2575442 RepID=A0A4U3MPU4_9ACTN|nr:SDR family oxidoreductase [Herbidospora galbida]TKK90066.1 SDR family NAD(P)-dependent oxidoreductase [Herbidospora galbida]